MMRTKIVIAIAVSVVFLTVCFGAYSAERDDTKVVRTTPGRVARTPARPPSPSEEEAPRPRPVTRTPTRTTPTRTPSRRTPTRPTPVRIKPPDPHKDTVILVEAFMVQAKLSALRSLDVPQISEGCKSVSAEQIIKLMKTTDAAVLKAGAKLSVGHNNKAETRSSTHHRIISGPPDKKVVRTEYVEVGTTFSAFATIRSCQKIYLDIGFDHSSVEEGDGKLDPALFVEREWTSSITLQEGKPTLVGALQDKETGTFLIVTTNIKE